MLEKYLLGFEDAYLVVDVVFGAAHCQMEVQFKLSQQVAANTSTVVGWEQLRSTLPNAFFCSDSQAFSAHHGDERIQVSR
jgi:hypothetical protein